MSRHLVVEIVDDPEHARFPTTLGGIFAGILAVNGVKSVDDMDVISPTTLASWLMPEEQSLVPKKRRR